MEEKKCLSVLGELKEIGGKNAKGRTQWIAQRGARTFKTLLSHVKDLD